jgi:uncharacterized protein (TIGR03118 family)
MNRASRNLLLVTFCLLLASVTSFAQYKLTKLVSNVAGAKHVDTQLVNAWGIAFGPNAPFWVSDNGTGLSTLYKASGVKQSLVVTIPTASGTGTGSPTGIVFQGTSEFQIRTWPSAFIFATLDGTISGWSHFNPNAALIAVTNPGATYTGLAVTSHPSGNMIYAADFANNKVDVYDGKFKFVTSFTDHSLPPNFGPYGIQDINGQVYVSFASTVFGPGGFIDIFGEDGTFVKTLTSDSHLDLPWGMAVAPSNFGPLSNTLLVGNVVQAGTINGFDLATGAFVGTVSDKKHNPILIEEVWGIEFGGGSAGNGKTNQLFFTAGPSGYADGLFGVIK